MEINGKHPLLTGLNGGFHRTELDARIKRLESSDEGINPSGSDRIELSVRGREVRHLDYLIQSTPDIRQDKIDAVRREIEAGTYNVKAEKIADKILGGGLIDGIF